MGAIPLVEIQYSQAAALPGEIAIAINDRGVIADTCTNPSNNLANSPGAQLRRNESGHDAVATIQFDYFPELSAEYFSSRSAPPIRYDITYQIYGRSACSEPLVLIGERNNIAIAWQPLYPNGISCGIDGYMARITDP
jgi:hypothetical protein